MNLNKVFLIGRLTADPEVRNTAGGQNVSTIRIATNRVWVNKTGEKQEQVEFHTVVAWARLAEIVEKYVRKGQMIFIEGRLQTRSWQTSDGTKRYRTEIVAEGLQLGPKSTGTTSSRAPMGEEKTAEAKEEEIPVINQDEPIIHDSDKDVGEAEIDLKDIPF